jgi:4-hydroxythreonine-4-phosphate dehydrogenase
MNTSLPLAVTMGDASGIGPEIVAKTMLARTDLRRNIVVGDPAVMAKAIASLGGGLPMNEIHDVADAKPDGALNILAATRIETPPALGKVSATSGRMAYDAVVAAIDLARTGKVAGIVTAPIHKEALAAAGLPYPGHTEILAAKGGAGRVAMMLANDDIRSVLVTIHCSLADAIRQADFPAQMSAIRLAHQGGRALGFARPRIAVAGLNPHAGEGGLFGDEEIRIIAPAIAAARSEGIDASGPWPGDTVFMQARNGRFDLVVAQYHDQGHIPMKLVAFDTTVNVSLGLPIDRASVDHGTAFDIAGTGKANHVNMHAAIAYAKKLAGTPKVSS